MTIEAFEHMANTLRPQLVELCERFMANRQLHEEAEDMVQETLFRLWQMRGRLDSYQSPEALAVTIAKNVCIDRLRVFTRSQRFGGAEFSFICYYFYLWVKQLR